MIHYRKQIALCTSECNIKHIHVVNHVHQVLVVVAFAICWFDKRFIEADGYNRQLTIRVLIGCQPQDSVTTLEWPIEESDDDIFALEPLALVYCHQLYSIGVVISNRFLMHGLIPELNKVGSRSWAVCGKSIEIIEECTDISIFAFFLIELKYSYNLFCHIVKRHFCQLASWIDKFLWEQWGIVGVGLNAILFYSLYAKISSHEVCCRQIVIFSTDKSNCPHDNVNCIWGVETEWIVGDQY